MAPARAFAQAAPPPPAGPFKLPPLGYANDALEPHIDATTMMIHHDRHHAAYVANANGLAVKWPELATTPIETVLAEGAAPEDFARQLAEAGAKVAVLCSSAKVYAGQGIAVAEALRAAGAEQVLLAGQIKELGEGGDAAVDGNVFDGMNVVELLTNTLNKLGA